jgi:uncharacterized repeat protein (TIGR03803 family)
MASMSVRRGGKSSVGVRGWLGGCFTPARRSKGALPADPLRHHRLLIEPLEERRLLSATITSLASFADYGANPYAGVVEDSSGDLFGTTQSGGASNDGTVFEIKAGSGAVTTLASFNGANGENPDSSVVEDSSGNLFGTTGTGGANGDGTVFEIKAGSGAVTTLVSFNGTNGQYPVGAIVEDSSGNLFGTTNEGGASGDGTVFEVKAGSGAVTTIASFNSANGEWPYGGVVEDSSGNLFGTTLYGGADSEGTVFEIKAGSGAVTTLVSFNGTNGDFPYASMVEDSSGNLFGTTRGGGASSEGTVFEIKSGSGAVTTLASFNGTKGESPQAGVVEDSSGNLFGTTYQGGSSGVYGTVFEIKSGSGAVTTLASFNDYRAGPVGGVVEDSSGNLFGTTSWGGADSDGTVFEIQAGSGAVTTLASFNATNGQNPEAGVVEDSSGNLFGTTENGGADSDGTVFEIKAGSGAVTDLAPFFDTNGENPQAGVVEDSSGNLFGTTYRGGASNDGTVFEIKPGGAVTTLASFNATNGQYPYAGVVEDSSGNLFGTTYQGGAYSDGTVFEIKAGSGAVATLASFNGTNGADPRGGVVEDSSGDLFGTTENGGADSDGTVFEIKAGSGAVTTLVSFNSTNGANPCAGLVMDSSGNLFGMTEYGGASGDGTVFEVSNTAATTVSVTSSPASVVYGNSVTFTANVSASSGSIAPTAGSVDFYDTTTHTDLGDGTLGSSTGTTSTWTLATGVKTFNATTGDTITATYTPGTNFAGSSGTTTQMVTARPITVTAATATKTYDGTTSSTAVPTITGGSLATSDTAAFTEQYVSVGAGAGLTLVPGGSVNDGNGGNNYLVTWVDNYQGVIYGPSPAYGPLAGGALSPPSGTGAPTVSTFAGNGISGPTGLAFDGAGNLYVADDGDRMISKVTPSGAVSTFVSTGPNYPFGLACDAAGNLYVANYYGNTISEVTPSGTVSTFAGAGTYSPYDLAFDAAGNLYVANWHIDTISKITPSGTVSTFVSASSGIDQPEDLAFDAASNLYVSSAYDSAIFKVTPSGTVSTFVGSGLDEPEGLACDAAGNLYVANPGNNTISKVTPSGTVSTFVSSGLDGAGGLAFDAAGNLYVTNYYGNTISKVTPSGTVSTFVGNGLDKPFGVAFDDAADLYVANEANNTISKITPSGTVSTFVSSGLDEPGGLAFDTAGNLYVANYSNNTISKVTPSGTVSTFVGSGLDVPDALAFDAAGNLYVASETAPGTISKVTPSGTVSTFVSSGLDDPKGLAFDAAGNLYVTNYNGSTISKVAPSGTVSTFVSGGLGAPIGLAFDAAGNLYAANEWDSTIFKIAPPELYEDQPFSGTVFRFTDSNPQATASDYTAVVTLGDGNSVTLNSSDVVSGPAGAGGQIVADPNGGFDVQLSYTYTKALSYQTFAVKVTDLDGASTGASTSAFSVASSTPIATTTCVNTSQTPVAYGTPVTFTATVAAQTESAAPTAGSVDFYDSMAGCDLGTGTLESSSGTTSVWTLTTGVKALNATTGDTITATYTPGPGFASSGGTTTQVVTPLFITVAAAPNAKTYDGTTIATAVPIITDGSLVSGDTAVFSEAYSTSAMGAGKTLTPAGSVDDGNGGNDYVVTWVENDDGVIYGLTPAYAPLAGGALSPPSGTGAPTVSTLAGNGIIDPLALAFDAVGNLYVQTS